MSFPEPHLKQKVQGAAVSAGLQVAPLLADEYRPSGPPAEVSSQFGIGIVGTGTIVQIAHLPSYRKFGYKVVGLCDTAEQTARSVAEKFDVPYWTTNVDELLARPDVDVIDLAVHAHARLPLVKKIAAAGKHILSQKPFAMNLPDAEKMVEICERAGVTIMVNQQARWAPAHRALKVLVDKGVLGHVSSVVHVHRSFQDIPGSWYVGLKDFNLMDHGIHYIDLTRYFTGKTPQRVKATTVNVPGQVAVSPMMYSILCEYAPEDALMSTLHFNNIVESPRTHEYTWYLDGTKGSAVATHERVTIALRDTPDDIHVIKLQGTWFYEAFGASMGELLTALAEGRAPLTAARDNLETIRLANAALISANTGSAVDLRSQQPV